MDLAAVKENIRTLQRETDEFGTHKTMAAKIQRMEGAVDIREDICEEDESAAPQQQQRSSSEADG
jgi:hypothetical protein